MAKKSETSKTSYMVAPNLYLVHHVLDTTAPAKPVQTSVNHLAIIDCSGSMSYDLPKIREQLKKKLPKLLGEKDTMSIIWFSGKGQCGTLLEAEPVSTLTDLQAVNAAIDRWLKPIGLTGFKEPLIEAKALTERVAKKHPGPFSLFFMSDGCDNQWPRADILKAVESAAGSLAATTIVEYGYYADRPLLAAMAERAGGSHIFAEDFDRYAPQFEAVLQKKVVGGKRVQVEIEGDPIGAFTFALSDGDLLTFGLDGNGVAVPEGLKGIYYLSPKPVGKVATTIVAATKVASTTPTDEQLVPNSVLDATYAAVSLFSVRMKPEVVYPVLKALGDVAFIEEFSGCFGKQKYSAFMDAAKLASFDTTKRYVKGWDPDKVPRDDAFTVLDLLRMLDADDANRLLLDHESFKYSRIGRGRVDADSQLSEAEIEEIQQLTAQMAGVKDPAKIKDLTARIASITAGKKEALKFVADPCPDGYEVSKLTYNEARPNISVLVRKVGTVDISGRIPAEFKGKLPDKIKTNIYRNYAIVKDGLVNVSALPVRLSRESAEKISKLAPAGTLGVIDVNNRRDGDFLIDLTKLPIINRQMVKAVSARTMFAKEYDLCKAQAAQKVFNTVQKDKFPRKSEGFEALYGADAAKWLKEDCGITDYNGFQPAHTTQAEATDVYMAKELKVSLKGLSSLPSLKDVRDKMTKAKEAREKGKAKGSEVTGAAALMVPYVEAVDTYLDSDEYKNAANKDKAFQLWLEDKQKAAVSTARKLIFELAQIKFAIVVGQTWPVEFASLDENSLEIDTDAGKLACKVEMLEKETKI